MNTGLEEYTLTALDRMHRLVMETKQDALTMRMEVLALRGEISVLREMVLREMMQRVIKKNEATGAKM